MVTSLSSYTLSTVACGDVFTVAVSNSKCYTFGSNQCGQLGYNRSHDDHKPAMVTSLSSYTLSTVACGDVFTVAVSNRKCYTFGSNQRGQLGYNRSHDDHKPAMVTSLSSYTLSTVACGDVFTVAVSNSKCYTFGSNQCGQLGYNRSHDDHKPAMVTSLSSYTLSTVACGDVFTVAVSNSKCYTFGSNQCGQLGYNRSHDDRKPAMVTSLSSYTLSTVACGDVFTVAISNSNCYTFGSNQCGQLGYNRSQDDHKPAMVSSLTSYTLSTVACGDVFTVAVSNNKCYTFGSNQCGQLGYNRSHDDHKPAMVTSLSSYTLSTVACGDVFTVAVSNSKCYTFGSNQCGQLGYNRSHDDHKPAMVTSLSSYTLSTVACGDVFTVAVSNSKCYTFGSNQCGQLGYNRSHDDHKPAMVTSLTSYTLSTVANRSHELLVAMSSLWLFLTVSVTHLDPINVGSLVITGHMMITSQLWSLV